MSYHEHLPQRLAGAFGQFMGASEAQSKGYLRDCMREFDAIEEGGSNKEKHMVGPWLDAGIGA
eukprot:2160906-Pyramimonas_sp.AAC.1